MTNTLLQKSTCRGSWRARKVSFSGSAGLYSRQRSSYAKRAEPCKQPGRTSRRGGSGLKRTSRTPGSRCERNSKPY